MHLSRYLYPSSIFSTVIPMRMLKAMSSWSVMCGSSLQPYFSATNASMRTLLTDWMLVPETTRDGYIAVLYAKTLGYIRFSPLKRAHSPHRSMLFRFSNS